MTSAANRVQRYIAFAEKQRKARRWVRLNLLAFHFARTRCPNDLDKQPPAWADLWVMQGYSALASDIRDGFFSSQPPANAPFRGTRLQLLYLHPAITPARMTDERLEVLSAMLSGDSRESQMAFYANSIACCWVSADLVVAWCNAHDLPPIHAKRGRTVKDDALALAYAASLVEQGHTLRSAACESVASFPDLDGASDEAKIDRLRRKLKELKPTLG